MCSSDPRRRFLLEGPLLYRLGELEDEPDVDVRLEERPLDVPNYLLYRRLVNGSGARELPEGVVKGLSAFPSFSNAISPPLL